MSVEEQVPRARYTTIGTGGPAFLTQVSVTGPAANAEADAVTLAVTGTDTSDVPPA